jgi:hypothetical protein
MATVVLRALANEESASAWSAAAAAVFERLSECQRRWVAGLMSKAIGHGGDTLLSNLTGLDPQTVQAGRREVDANLADCPSGRVRRPGAGRPRVEKKIPACSNSCPSSSSRRRGAILVANGDSCA